jgi:Tol biopolymer transport system component
MYMTNEKQRETKQDLWVLPLKGDGKPFPFLVTPAIENQGVFSPDTKWVVYVSDAHASLAGAGQIYVRPFPGPGAPRPVSTGGGRAPRFSLDGKRIFFVDHSKLMAADFHADGKVTEPVALFQLDETIQDFQPMPDGRFLMLLYKDADASPLVRIIANWQPPA